MTPKPTRAGFWVLPNNNHADVPNPWVPPSLLLSYPCPGVSPGGAGPRGLTGVGGHGFADVGQGTVDRLLGLVPVLAQEDVAELLPQLRLQQPVLDLLLDDIVCNTWPWGPRGDPQNPPKSAGDLPRSPLKSQHNNFWKQPMAPSSFLCSFTDKFRIWSKQTSLNPFPAV